ncbi:MAG: hypothetical protein R3C19_07855 [Planctomycetaceae bacterium]
MKSQPLRLVLSGLCSAELPQRCVRRTLQLSDRQLRNYDGQNIVCPLAVESALMAAVPDDSEPNAKVAVARRFGVGEWLLTAGLVLYVASMFLPVLEVEIAAPHAIVGWEAAWICAGGLVEVFKTGPSVLGAALLFTGLQPNLCFLAGWTIVWWKRPTVRWLTVGTFGAAAILATVFPLLINGNQDSVADVYRELMVGYYAWILSFVVMALGAALRLRSVERSHDSC